MRKARVAALVTAAVAVLLSPALAQEQEREQATFRLKFKPGQAVRFRGYVKGDAVVGISMQPAPPTPMPQQLNMSAAGTVVATAKPIRQDQWGNTRLNVRLDSLRMSMDMMGQKFEMALEGGKVAVTSGGQKMPPEKLPTLPGGQAIPLLQKPIEVKVGTRGQLMDIVIPGFEKEMAQIRQMYGGVDPMVMWRQAQILLPENPVTVGDSWTEHQEQPIPNMGTAAVTDTTFTLESIKEVNGEKVAQISVNSTSMLPNLDLAAAARQGMAPGAPSMQGLSGNMTMQTALVGTALFNLTAGMMDRLDFRANMTGEMAMTVPVPQQGQQAGPASMAINIQGQFQGAVARLK